VRLRPGRTEPSSGNCLRRSAHGVAPCVETRAARGASVARRGPRLREGAPDRQHATQGGAEGGWKRVRGGDDGSRRQALTQLSDVGEGAYPSVKTLMVDTGMSNRSVATHLAKAEAAGLLKIERTEAGADGR